MSNCKKYKDLIEQYLDGTITDSHLAELQKHTQTCEFCREEFDKSVLLQKTIKDAFSSTITAEQARVSVIAKLAEKENHQIRIAGVHPTWFVGKRIAVAAGILLAVGLFLGFALGRAGAGKRVELPTAKAVPIKVADLEGTVLVKHEGSDLWHVLTSESKVYLGDTFHSTAKSTCVLKLDPNSTLELDQNSMLVLALHNGTTEFNLEHGQCKASLESPHGPFFISTPHGRNLL